MSTGQTLDRLDRCLGQMQGAIRQGHLNLLGSQSTPTVGDVQYEEFWGKLERHGETLKAIQLQLRNIDHLLTVREQRAWSLSRAPRGVQGSPRYRERQSIESHRRQLEQVRGRTTAIEALLGDLYFRGQHLTTKDVFGRVRQLVKDGEAFFTKYKTLEPIQGAKPDHPSVGGTPPGGGAATALSLELLVALITYYITKRNRPDR